MTSIGSRGQASLNICPFYGGLASLKGVRSSVVKRVKEGKNEELKYDRIFLAAGAMNSTRIILHSLDAFDRSVEFKDCQKFVRPIFRRRGQPYQIKKMNSRSSLFIELR